MIPVRKGEQIFVADRAADLLTKLRKPTAAELARVVEVKPSQWPGVQGLQADGSVATDVCYWGDMTFFPHLVRLMSRKQVLARVRFAAIGERAGNRKELAQQLHAAVLQLLT